MGFSRVRDVEFFFVGGEAEAVWFIKILYDDGQLLRGRVVAKYPITFEFLLLVFRRAV